VDLTREEKTRQEREAGREAVLKHEMEEWKEELAKKYTHEVFVREKDDEVEVKFTIHKHVDDVREYKKGLNSG
jgi:hypothetical protein